MHYSGVVHSQVHIYTAMYSSMSVVHSSIWLWQNPGVVLSIIVVAYVVRK